MISSTPHDLPEPSQPINLFFALRPDRQAAAKAYALAQRHRVDRGLQGRPLAMNRLHITLLSVGVGAGPAPKAIMEIAAAVGNSVRLEAFEVSLNHALSFVRRNGKRSYVLLGEDGVIELMMLQVALAGAMLKHRDDFRKRPRFVPHMTLLYDDLQLAGTVVEPISWVAREFVLIESWIGLTKHVVRGRWHLPEDMRVHSDDPKLRHLVTLAGVNDAE